MMELQTYHFGPFRVDLQDFRVWRGATQLALTPKAFAVLHYFLEHPARLITKDELFTAVWPDTVVSEDALKACIKELRRVLGDQSRPPRFIETVHKRGFRFFPPVTTTSPVVSRQLSGISRQEPAASPQLATGNWQLPTPLVGRDAELTRLNDWLAKALNGERQIVFVTGEAGIGKTTIVETFLHSVSEACDARIASGQCIEHYGSGEAYLPALDALGQLCRAPGGERVGAMLEQHAPTWLLQLPAFISADDRERLQRQLLGATKERMLREMAEALEALAAERPLIVCLEDLQWSDYATVDLVSFLARRRQPARLALLCTYRPVDVIVNQHPVKVVKQELQARGHCQELALSLLDETAVAAYITQRLHGEGGQDPLLPKLAQVVHRRTDGNPLFMVNVTNDLLERKLLVAEQGRWELRAPLTVVAAEAPESLRHLIEQQLERLSEDEQRALAAASVVGAQFSTTEMAAALSIPDAQAETHCQALARRGQFLRPLGIIEWPDGSLGERYAFTHALYQDTLYQRVSESQRMRFHQRLGQRLESAHGKNARDTASILALHFERGRDYSRAIRYYRHAGETALQRSAHREAIGHLTKGLELLQRLPEGEERTQHELRLQTALGTPLLATKGLADPVVGETYQRALTLCRQVGDTPHLFSVLWGIWGYTLVRGELAAAHEFAQQRLALAQQRQEPALLVLAHLTLGTTRFYLGDLRSAHEHFAQSLALYDPERYRGRAYFDDLDPGVTALAYFAWTLWLEGFLDQALQKNQDALTLARRIDHPHSEALALSFSTWFRHLSRDADLALEETPTLLTLARQHGYPMWLAAGFTVQGWALSQHGQGDKGAAQTQQGINGYRATGAQLSLSYWLTLLAEARETINQFEEGLHVIDDALAIVQHNGERYWEAELYRLYGELLLRIGETETRRTGDAEKETEKEKTVRSLSDSSIPRFPDSSPGDSSVPRFADSFAEFPVSSPEEAFLKALTITRQQGAKLLELRAARSLSRLWQRQGKIAEARAVLSEVYGWFTEGFATADLQEAQALLQELH